MSAAGFPAAARIALADAQLRRNLGKATTAIRVKRARAVAELDDWEALRDAGAAIKARAMATLPEQLERLEERVTRAGGTVHWARDGAEANAIIAGIAREHGADEVIKVKSLATDEIGLNEALGAARDRGDRDRPRRADRPARRRRAVPHPRPRDPPQPRGDRDAVRAHDRAGAGARAGAGGDRRGRAAAPAREVPLGAGRRVSGANFAIAETGAVGVVESEGNGRMCTTLPKVLITLMGIEKVLPEWRDLEVMLQLLPRSSTAERMNPYTSIWTGVREDDGPREFHLVLLDAGRTQVLADEVGRQALHCIRCSACLNSCPVYSRTGGHAYESVYPGPIGAILTPQLAGLDAAPTLPWASSLCGACYEVCPVKIDIPTGARAPARAGRAGGRSRAGAPSGWRWTRSRACSGRAAPTSARSGWRGPGNGPIASLPGPLSGWTDDARPARGAEAVLPRVVAGNCRRAGGRLPAGSAGRGNGEPDAEHRR